MDHKLIRLAQKPCVVKYLNHYDKFIVGTYQLLESADLISINQRAGKLIIISQSVEYEFDCTTGGGVFDFKLQYNKLDSSYKIFVGHSNGILARYTLHAPPKMKITTESFINITTKTTLLTSVSFFTHIPGELPRLAVGDSTGCLTVMNSDEKFNMTSVSPGDSIWSVECLDSRFGNLVIVGSENCSWSIYAIEFEETTTTTLLYCDKSKQFDAGITSISVLRKTQTDDLDTLDISIGSYDETLRLYRIEIFKDSDCKIPRVSVLNLSKLRIPNAGIWTVKLYKEKSEILVSAMYAGTYRVDLKTLTDPISLVDLATLNLEFEPLHYDVDHNNDGSQICIADFNNSLCLLLNKKE